MRALMLAAGFGERLKPHTTRLAKPAIPFLNVPIMAYPLFYMERAGLTDLIVNTHHLPGTVEAAAKSLVKRKVKLQFSHEKEKLLASGGGLAQAMATFGESEHIVFANADAVALYKDPMVLKRAIEKHESTNALATLVLCPFPDVKEALGGVYVDSSGRVKKFSKTPLKDPNLKAYHWASLMVLRKEVWQGLSTEPSNILYDVLQKKIDAGAAVESLIVDDVRFFETGNQKDYLGATEEALAILSEPGPFQNTLIQILDRYTPDWWKGWRTTPGPLILGSLPWPDRLKVTGFAVFGADAIFGSNVHLERSVVAGPAELKTDFHLRNSLLVGEATSASLPRSASPPPLD